MGFRPEMITERHWYFLFSILIFFNVTVFGCFVLFLTHKICFGC